MSISFTDLVNEFTGDKTLVNSGITTEGTLAKGLYDATRVSKSSELLPQPAQVRFLTDKIQDPLLDTIRRLHDIVSPKGRQITFNGTPTGQTAIVSEAARTEFQEFATPFLQALIDFTKKLVPWVEKHGKETIAEPA